MSSNSVSYYKSVTFDHIFTENQSSGEKRIFFLVKSDSYSSVLIILASKVLEKSKATC